MEKQIFSWEGWDDNGPESLQFYKCILKVDFGPFKAGERFECIEMSIADAYFGFYRGEDEQHVTVPFKIVEAVQPE